MIDRADLRALTPAQRAQIIYSAAQSELAGQLWRAALGDAGMRPAAGGITDLAKAPGDSLLQLLAALEPARHAEPLRATDSTRNAAADRANMAGAGRAAEVIPAAAPLAIPMRQGRRLNSSYAASFAAAEQRTGIPASALAAIVGAEAGKRADGSWNPFSRNPRSSAAGLGQFLSGTWQSVAETPGSWLNGVAQARGWLDGNGKMRAEARSDLLALRYDPGAAIHSVADYASTNLNRLERAGLHVRDDAITIARAAYLSHHLGVGDAQRFLRGGLQPGHARTLLHAQVGTADAERRIAQAGNAATAHREWLLGYIARNIRPDSVS